MTAGITGKVHGLSAADGTPAWELDLHERFGRQERREEYGYSGIPMAYGGRVLVPLGGERHAVLALDPEDGSVEWGSPPRRVSYAPPRLVRLGGKDHYVFFSPNEVIGMDPATGEFLWEYPVECVTENNLTSVVACSADYLWVATQIDGGTRVLEVTEADKGWRAEPLWTSRTLKQGHWSAICRGDHVYGSLGDSSSMLGAVAWRTGETAWKERGFHGAQVLFADGKLIFLDQAGQLGLARVSPEGLELLALHPLLEEISWTVPTLVGTTLYARDRKRIVAVDLGAE